MSILKCVTVHFLLFVCLHVMQVAHVQLQVCYTQLCELWALAWRHCLVSGCFVSSWPGGLLNTSSELTGSAASGLRSARSAAETFLNIDRRSVCVTRHDLFILTQLWPLTWLAGETGRQRVGRVSRFSRSRTQNKSLVCSWQLIRNLGAQSAAESKRSFLITCLHQPIRNQQACALHTWSCSLYSHADTHKHSLLCKQQHHCKKTIN